MMAGGEGGGHIASLCDMNGGFGLGTSEVEANVESCSTTISAWGGWGDACGGGSHVGRTFASESTRMSTEQQQK